MENLKIIDYTKRKLNESYIAIYALQNSINIKKSEIIEKVDIYTLVGINKDGIRELIGIYQDKALDNRYWLDIFENIKSRGIKTILFFSVDDNKNLKRAAKIAFPMITFVDSIMYIIPKFYKYISEKSPKSVASRINKLYTQHTLEDYKNEFALFNEKYNNNIHKKLIEKYLNNVESFYKYSYNIRNFLFTINANMSLHDRIRLSFNSNKGYICDLNEIYENLETAENLFGFISFNKNQWTLIFNDLILLYPDTEFI